MILTVYECFTVDIGVRFFVTFCAADIISLLAKTKLRAIVLKV